MVGWEGWLVQLWNGIAVRLGLPLSIPALLYYALPMQHGAAVDQAATVHEEEEHLERPLLTAAHVGNVAMMQLLIQVGKGRVVWGCG